MAWHGPNLTQRFARNSEGKLSYQETDVNLL